MTTEYPRARRTPAVPLSPTITDPRMVAVQFTGGPDEQGRRQFFAYWLTDNSGPALNETGTRGQVFHTWPERFAARWEVDGYRVEYLNS